MKGNLNNSLNFSTFKLFAKFDILWSNFYIRSSSIFYFSFLQKCNRKFLYMDDNKVCYDKCTMILKYPGTYRTPPEDVL